MSSGTSGEGSPATTMYEKGVVNRPSKTEAPGPLPSDDPEAKGAATGSLETKSHISELNETIYVDFEEGDPRNPVNFSSYRKWAITIMGCLASFFASSCAAAYSTGVSTMIRDLECTQFQATIGLAVFPLGFGVIPLVTASFSEEFGRRPLYIVTSIGFLLMYLAIALAKNIQTVIVIRFLQGGFGSTGATMVGGTIADIFGPKDRGLPMAVFSLSALGGTGLGPVYAGWIEMNPRLGWRWIQWIQMIMYAAYTIFVPIIMTETRTAILLTHIAKELRKKTGNLRYRARVEDERTSLRKLIIISCTRPLHLMLTEPVVTSFSLWIGFIWGLVFSLIESTPGVFRTLHGFNIGQIGTIYVTMFIGSLIGCITHYYFQEDFYRKGVAKRGPEARLYTALLAAILLPASIFIFAWTSFSHVPWIAQAIAIVVFFWATFNIYAAVFSYLADCYGPFASSALAGQSLARNVLATVFPLFTEQMFRRLGYSWANTLFALIGTVMIPIPFILFFNGKAIRRHSKFSRMVLEAQEQK